MVWKSAKHVQTSLNSGPAILFTVDTNSHVISLVLGKIIQWLTRSSTISVLKYVWNIILIQYRSQKDVLKCTIFLFIRHQALKNFNHVTLREWNKHGAGINLPLTTHATLCGDKSLFFTIASNISVTKIDLIIMRSVTKCMYDSSSSFWWVQWSMQSWKCDTFFSCRAFSLSKLSERYLCLVIDLHHILQMLLHYSVHKTKMCWCWHELACSWTLKNENDLTRWVRLRVLLLDEFDEGRWQHRSFHVHISRHWLHGGGGRGGGVWSVVNVSTSFDSASTANTWPFFPPLHYSVRCGYSIPCSYTTVYTYICQAWNVRKYSQAVHIYYLL